MMTRVAPKPAVRLSTVETADHTRTIAYGLDDAVVMARRVNSARIIGSRSSEPISLTSQGR
jgi:hypothetical protein